MANTTEPEVNSKQFLEKLEQRNHRTSTSTSSRRETLVIMLHNCRLTQQALIRSAKNSGNTDLLKSVSPNGMGKTARQIRRYLLELHSLDTQHLKP